MLPLAVLRLTPAGDRMTNSEEPTCLVACARVRTRARLGPLAPPPAPCAPPHVACGPRLCRRCASAACHRVAHRGGGASTPPDACALWPPHQATCALPPPAVLRLRAPRCTALPWCRSCVTCGAGCRHPPPTSTSACRWPSRPRHAQRPLGRWATGLAGRAGGRGRGHRWGAARQAGATYRGQGLPAGGARGSPQVKKKPKGKARWLRPGLAFMSTVLRGTGPHPRQGTAAPAAAPARWRHRCIPGAAPAPCRCAA